MAIEWGVVGTLSGIVVGWLTNYITQERQLWHQDKTRFQDQRMATYLDFAVCANKIVAKWRSGIPEFDLFFDLNIGMEKIRIMAESSVVKAAASIHENLVKLGSQSGGNAPTVDQVWSKDFDQKIVGFVRAARSELKIK